MTITIHWVVCNRSYVIVRICQNRNVEGNLCRALSSPQDHRTRQSIRNRRSKLNPTLVVVHDRLRAACCKIENVHTSRTPSKRDARNYVYLEPVVTALSETFPRPSARVFASNPLTFIPLSSVIMLSITCLLYPCIGAHACTVHALV